MYYQQMSQARLHDSNKIASDKTEATQWWSCGNYWTNVDPYGVKTIQINSKSEDVVTKATFTLLKPLKEVVYAIRGDTGKEFV